jgi:tRNA-splicing ligase RtcB
MNKNYTTFGKEIIEQGALTQMDNVMSLAPVVKGALMPDAHQGYGMPIGGVCAVENAVIPYAVGVDIGCRMHLTVYGNIQGLGKCEGQESIWNDRLKNALRRDTYFGGTSVPRTKNESPIFDDPRWALLEKHKIANYDGSSLKDRAWVQLGTSGGGNHFVEWGDLSGEYSQFENNGSLALLSHSGSRSLGFTVANYFTKLAAKINPLPAPLNELSWLSMDTEEGQDYWNLMELCGEYSAENHKAIHRSVERTARLIDSMTAEISNHHNFAWREEVDGKMLYVHRKGATPAQKDLLGIIPSSMATKAYIVAGTGNADSLCSASHGSGRAMSRSQAIKNITVAQRNDMLKDNGVELLGAGIDESPQAYKPIEAVMNFQKDLVAKIAEFQPRIVRMGGKSEQDKSEGS